MKMGLIEFIYARISSPCFASLGGGYVKCAEKKELLRYLKILVCKSRYTWEYLVIHANPSRRVRQFPPSFEEDMYKFRRKYKRSGPRVVERKEKDTYVWMGKE